jgi:predicted transcriptional regulator
MESDYALLKRMEILTLTKGDWVTRNDIVRTTSQKIKLDDLDARGLVSRVGDNEYRITSDGQALIDSFELKNKQVEELGTSDEDLKLEILMRMADYYFVGEYQLLTQDDIITNAVKHQFDIPSNKYFGIVVKLLQDGFVEKDPSGLTDSIRLTTEGYDKANSWFEVNPNEETPIEQPAQFQPTDLQVSILEAVEEAGAKNVGDDFVKIVDIWRYNMGMMPINYAVYQMDLTTPSMQQDLAIWYSNGYLEFAQTGLEAKDYRYRLSQKGKDFLDSLKTQTTPPTTQANLRPSPTFSATKYATGVTMVGNDMSLWRVTENKNGVKRWVKVGDTPSELPDPTNLDVGSFVYGKLGKIYRVWLNENNKKELVEVESIANPKAVETPISEIDEDEVDLDILEQQLNDDSLEFDLTDEDLDNLEF